MIKWFIHRYVRNMERHYDYDATYLHELADISTTAFRRFIKMQLAGGQWRADTPKDAWFSVGIAGALVEDCGPCVQITTDMAVEGGMSPETIRALLSGAPTNSDAQLGFDYGRALLTNSDDLDGLRDAIVSRWGKSALVALSLRAMSGRNFPVLKRAMGHAKTCQRVRVGNAEIAVNQALKAA